MSTLEALEAYGVAVTLAGENKLRVRGRGKAAEAVAYIRKNKAAIIKELTQAGAPGQCESCPAAGHWDYIHYANQGLLCFHRAYYLGKPGKPKPCSEVRHSCPRHQTTEGKLR